MAEQPVAEVFTFPTDPAEFENDDRISFSKLDNKFIAVQESDGTEFEFDQQLKRWIPVADEDEEAFIQQHQIAYGNAQDPGADSSAQPSNGRKRKQDQVEVSCARWSVRGGRDNPCTLPRLSQVAFMIAPDGQCRRTCNGDQKQQYLPSSTAYGNKSGDKLTRTPRSSRIRTIMAPPLPPTNNEKTRNKIPKNNLPRTGPSMSLVCLST